MNKPWSQIVARYQEYQGKAASIRALLKLSQYICNSNLKQGLYAWTSMFDLCITQTEVTYPYDGPFLRLSPTQDDQVEFRYIDSWKTEDQWHRTVAPEEVIPRLLKFLDQLRWSLGESS